MHAIIIAKRHAPERHSTYEVERPARGAAWRQLGMWAIIVAELCRLCITTGTARAQLQSIFAKTLTHDWANWLPF